MLSLDRHIPDLIFNLLKNIFDIFNINVYYISTILVKSEVIFFSSTGEGSISEMKEERVQMEDQHRQLADPTLPRWLPL